MTHIEVGNKMNLLSGLQFDFSMATIDLFVSSSIHVCDQKPLVISQQILGCQVLCSLYFLVLLINFYTSVYT